MEKVKFEELKGLDYEEGKQLLENFGYIGGNTGSTESNISDYVEDEYFTLYDDDGEEIDIISWEMYCNGSGEDVEVVKEGWSNALRQEDV